MNKFRKQISDKLLNAVNDRKAKIDEEDANKAKGVTDKAKAAEKLIRN